VPNDTPLQETNVTATARSRTNAAGGARGASVVIETIIARQAYRAEMSACSIFWTLQRGACACRTLTGISVFSWNRYRCANA